MGSAFASTVPHLRDTAEAGRYRDSRDRLSRLEKTGDIDTMATQEQKKANARLGWILLSIAVAFFIGFMVKMTWLH